MLAVEWGVAAASLAAAVAAAASPVEVGADASLVEVVAAAIAAGVVEGVVAERVQTVALLGAVPKAFVRVRRVWATLLFFLQPATK